MKHPAALTIASALISLLTGSIALGAQQVGTVQLGSLTAIAPSPAPTCPISLRAQHGNGSQLVKTRDKSDPRDMEQTTRKGVQQTIHLILTDLRHGHIIGATVRADGLTARPRIFPTLSAGGEASDVTRTVDASFSAEDSNSVSADLRLPGFAAVNSLKLLSVTYDDGSTRRFDGVHDCSVFPDPLALVSAH
jgi:hypothetical protein